MGNEAARDPEYAPPGDDMATMKHLLREGMKAGGFGFSGTFSGANRDFDGGYLPTHVVRREEMLEMAAVLRELNRGSIELTIGRSLPGLARKFLHSMDKGRGRTLESNAGVYNSNDAHAARVKLDW